MWIERRLAIAGIGLSLLLNIFLIGLIAGHLHAGGARETPGEHSVFVSAERVRALPPDEQAKFAAVMAAHKAALQAAHAAQLAAKHAVEQAIAAPAFNAADVTAGFAALRQANSVMQQQAHGALTEALATLSPAARAALVAPAAP